MVQRFALMEIINTAVCNVIQSIFVNIKSLKANVLHAMVAKHVNTKNVVKPVSSVHPVVPVNTVKPSPFSVPVSNPTASVVTVFFIQMSRFPVNINSKSIMSVMHSKKNTKKRLL